MSRGRRSESVSVGHDAFLDIVANLVGILIILVVVLGAQSQAVLREAKESPDESETIVTPVDPLKRAAGEDDMQGLALAAARAAAAQADSMRLERTIKVLDAQINRQSERRAMMLAVLQQAETAWEKQQEQLDEERRAAIDAKTKADSLKESIAELAGEAQRLGQREPNVVAVSHLPTPMAKTVFGKELHFRLKDNRLSVVPLDALTEEIRNDLRRLAMGSRQGVMDAAIGPIRGYVARYVLNRSNELVSRDNRLAQMARLQVMAASFEPLEEPHGTPINTVLASENWLDVELASTRPEDTTITVWVYPDSFAAFRRLKERLYAKGYATAARPLEQGRPIIASASGSRSAAQ
jgi:multidrug efflux pump subunit AcrA (membrane-fusion protein)